MITNSLPSERYSTAAKKLGIVALFIFLVTLGGVISLTTNLTTTYSTSAAAN